MSSHHYQLQLAADITIASIQNGLSTSDADNVVQFYDKICKAIEKRRIEWEEELTSTVEVASHVNVTQE